MKHQPIPEAESCNRENVLRAEVTLLCEVRQGLGPWKLAHLDDISQSGFRIARLPDAAMSRPLRIRIPGLQMLSAEIRWQKGKSVGCEFAEPLHVAVFEHILRAARIDGPLSK
ncbi:MAG: PilZ domain-containing protein [Novosphingobium sp.]